MTPRILAIDDSDQNLVLIELYLKGEGFDLLLAHSGREALDLVLAEVPDLILLDLVMPGMNGMEVHRQLQSDPQTARIPVIFLTGHMQDEAQMLGAYETGAVDYISKPVNQGELVARIKFMLQLRREREILETETTRAKSLLQESRVVASDLDAVLGEMRELVHSHAVIESGFLLIDHEGYIEAADEIAIKFLEMDPKSLPVKGLPEPWKSALAHSSQRPRIRDWEIVEGRERRVISVEHRALGSGYVQVCLRDVGALRGCEQRLRNRQDYSAGAGSVAKAETSYRVTGLIGSGLGMAEVSALVDKLRNVRTSVLIQGETGTGKELVARGLHYDGRYAAAPFIPIHCGAISPELIESELFGYEKGAFTGAMGRKEGLFSAADRGTVFLDEVSETSRELQVKLLRVLQLGEIRPVGATVAQHADVRIIAATNQDLRMMVRASEFREDLFYRLGVVTIRLPALRERPEDIPELAEHIAARVSGRQGRPDGHGKISKGAMDCLRAYPWPGNVRELENVIEAAISLGCGPTILQSDLSPEVLAGDPFLAGCPSVGEQTVILPSPGLRENSLASRRRMVVRSALVDALARFEGDKVEAALSLGMSRSTFYRKLKEHGVG